MGRWATRLLARRSPALADIYRGANGALLCSYRGAILSDAPLVEREAGHEWTTSVSEMWGSVRPGRRSTGAEVSGVRRALAITKGESLKPRRWHAVAKAKAA